MARLSLPRDRNGVGESLCELGIRWEARGMLDRIGLDELMDLILIWVHWDICICISKSGENFHAFVYEFQLFQGIRHKNKKKKVRVHAS